MNKSESKYYNTSLLMDEALVYLLNKKEYEFITIKEICEKAGVNRSTFYLHYDSIDDLLAECIENSTKEFVKYFSEDVNDFFKRFNDASANELMFVTPEYLTPYLNFIKDNKIFHIVANKHDILMNSTKRFNSLNKHVFMPIFKKYGIDEKDEKYMIVYYLNGINAIVNEWIKNGCKDEIEYIEKIIMDCVNSRRG